MNRLRALLTCVLLAALVTLVLCTILFVRKTTKIVAGLPALIERQIREQGDETRRAALAAIGETRRELLGDIDRTRGELLTRVDRLTKRTDAQLAGVQVTVAGNLTRLNDSIEEIADAAAGVKPVLTAAAGITAQIDYALPMFLDCTQNPDCAYNRYVGVAQSTEKAMLAVAATAPGTLKSVESTVGSVASIARSWEKRRPLYIRALGWMCHGLLRIKTLFF